MMNYWWSRLTTAVLGDPVDAGLQPKPTSYEEVHADVQSILLPSMYANGVSVHLLQPLNKHFALQHKMNLEPGKIKMTRFGPMPGPGDRLYSLGAVLTHRTEGGGKHRFAGQYDPENGNGKSTWVGDIWGDGRLRLQAQVVDARADNKTEWGFTARLRGEDYVAVARVKDSPEVGVSYNQRLCPGSPITLGGEMFLNIASLRAVGKAGGKGDKGPAAPPKRPMDWAIGAAYDAGGHKTAVHLSTASQFAGVLSVHHLYRITERASLAAKLMMNTQTGASMLSAGYKLRFRNTMSTLHGVIDSYGIVRTMIEREPIKDVRVGASLEVPLSAGGGTPALGFKITVGATSPITPPLSPCTLSRDIFSAA